MNLSGTIKPYNLKTRLPIKAELQRKAIHLLMALLLLVLYQSFSRPVIIGFFIALSVLAGLFEWLRIHSNPLALALQKKFSFLMRQEELASTGNRIHFVGATWVQWSLALLIILFPKNIMIACYIMFLIGDAMAAVIGKWIGRHFWPGSQKTVEGSLAFFVAGMMTMLLFPDTNFGIASLTVFFAAAAEIMDKPFNDNFRVPLLATTVYYIAGLLLL